MDLIQQGHVLNLTLFSPRCASRRPVTQRPRDCRELLSENLSDGQDYEGVKVVNPFALG